MSLFGTPAPAGGSLFGAPAAPAGGSLFGGASAAPTGSLFGGASAAPAGGSLFGGTASPAASSNLFGSTTATSPASGSLFGGTTAAAPTGSLFGSTAPAQTGSLFGSTTPAAPAGGSFFGSTAQAAPTTSLFGSSQVPANTGGMYNQQGMQQQQQQVEAPPFTAVAMALNRIPETPDLRYGVMPSANGNGDVTGAAASAAGGAPQQTMEVVGECVKAGVIPDMLKKPILQLQMEMNAQGRLLREVSLSTDDDLSTLLEQTSAMDQSVLALKNKLEQQRLSVKQLVHAAKESGKAAEGALHDARRSKGASHAAALTVQKAIPSEYLWTLVQSMEERLQQDYERTLELQTLVNTRAGRMEGGTQGNDSSNLTPEAAAAIMRAQHQGFCAAATNIASVHEKVNELRDQYRAWHMNTYGTEPTDFDQEEHAQKERNRRMLRKVEDQAAAFSSTQQQIATTAAATTTTPATTTATATQASAFGSTPTTPAAVGGSLFGASTPAATTTPVATTSLFGSTAPTTTAPAATGSLFGTPAPTTAASTPGASLFGSSFGGGAATGASAGSTTGSSLFGAPTATDSSSLFGNPNRSSGRSSRTKLNTRR